MLISTCGEVDSLILQWRVDNRKCVRVDIQLCFRRHSLHAKLNYIAWLYLACFGSKCFYRLCPLIDSWQLKSISQSSGHIRALTSSVENKSSLNAVIRIIGPWNKIFAVWSKTDVLVSINSTVFSFPREVIFGSPPVFPGIIGSCSQTLAWWFCLWHLKHHVVLWQSSAMCDFLRQIKHFPCLRSKDFLAFTSVITLQRTEGCDLWQ